MAEVAPEHYATRVAKVVRALEMGKRRLETAQEFLGECVVAAEMAQASGQAPRQRWLEDVLKELHDTAQSLMVLYKDLRRKG